MRAAARPSSSSTPMARMPAAARSSTGRRNPEQVEILSGLDPGDRIVTSNTASVKGDILNIR